MTDENEQSSPSRGSHGSPIAFGIRFWDGTLHGEVFQTFEAADKHLNPPHSPLRPEDVTAKVVPLYRSPTLTDEEREAIEEAAGDYLYHQDAGGRAQWIRTTLLGLLERLK